MTLAMTLGMSIGVRNTLWMMLGELLGVALVAIAAVIGVSAIMLKYPQVFNILKIVGAGYLLYVGINMWRSKGKLALNNNEEQTITINKKQLFNQGLITAIANPKGWAFFIALLPPFLDPDRALAGQLIVFTALILSLEFCCLLIYASGGRALAHYLKDPKHQRTLNRGSGTLLAGFGVWLMFG